MSAMKDSDLMPFGKYKGQKLGDVPASYLLWFADQDWASDRMSLLEYVEKNRKHLEEEKEEREEFLLDLKGDASDLKWK